MCSVSPIACTDKIGSPIVARPEGVSASADNTHADAMWPHHGGTRLRRTALLLPTQRKVSGETTLADFARRHRGQQRLPGESRCHTV